MDFIYSSLGVLFPDRPITDNGPPFAQSDFLTLLKNLVLKMNYVRNSDCNNNVELWENFTGWHRRIAGACTFGKSIVSSSHTVVVSYCTLLQTVAVVLAFG